MRQLERLGLLGLRHARRGCARDQGTLAALRDGRGHQSAHFLEITPDEASHGLYQNIRSCGDPDSLSTSYNTLRDDCSNSSNEVHEDVRFRAGGYHRASINGASIGDQSSSAGRQRSHLTSRNAFLLAGLQTGGVKRQCMPLRGFAAVGLQTEVATSGKLLRERYVPPGGFLALNNIRDNPGAKREKKRLGRGTGSGLGKTSGRGHKGQKARAGRKPRAGFEGGQTPLRLTIPKRGFHNPFSLEYQVLNLSRLTEFIERGKINPDKLITMKTLKDAGAIGKALRDGVKLLGRGSTYFKHPIKIEVSRVSSQARKVIEEAGGQVTTVHYNKLGLRALYKPEWFVKKGRMIPRAARPPPRLRGRVETIGRLPAPTSPLQRDTEVDVAVSESSGS